MGNCDKCNQPIESPVEHEFCRGEYRTYREKKIIEPETELNTPKVVIAEPVFSPKYQIEYGDANPHNNGKTEELLLVQKPITHNLAPPGAKPETHFKEYDLNLNSGRDILDNNWQDYGRKIVEEQ